MFFIFTHVMLRDTHSDPGLPMMAYDLLNVYYPITARLGNC